MDSTLRMASSIVLPISPSYSPKLNHGSINSCKVGYGFQFSVCGSSRRICAVSPNGSVSPSGSESSSTGNEQRRRSSLESLFCYDKPIPEERIEKPIGLSLSEKVIGDNPRCTECKAKGAVLCATCSGSGLYVDSILESQGIIVKVRCLGCGGTGNIMCAECGGRGYCGPK
ncbi:DnaJ/Hsp40 cysteine-rich domain superfamily protein [Citrus sinensis]|uniref:uncharacterized protein LOC102617578 n=1 Tax=Citrus sinensis TaxID=2711 RepID=UPI002199B6A9|nr:uncharacterized protein LOC102617578 [Citrus sinensis]KAH9728657.1 DnaJ/Hsp40 cysteine-rich domain superfamily protein [Citrus sinensis]